MRTKMLGSACSAAERCVATVQETRCLVLSHCPAANGEGGEGRFLQAAVSRDDGTTTLSTLDCRDTGIQAAGFNDGTT